MQHIFTGLANGALEQQDTCKGCTMGKYTKATFNDKDSQVQAILEGVHSKVCGPFLIAYTTKHRYYVIFIDDLSRK